MAQSIREQMRQKKEADKKERIKKTKKASELFEKYWMAVLDITDEEIENATDERLEKPKKRRAVMGKEPVEPAINKRAIVVIHKAESVCGVKLDKEQFMYYYKMQESSNRQLENTQMSKRNAKKWNSVMSCSVAVYQSIFNCAYAILTQLNNQKKEQEELNQKTNLLKFKEKQEDKKAEQETKQNAKQKQEGRIFYSSRR